MAQGVGDEFLNRRRRQQTITVSRIEPLVNFGRKQPVIFRLIPGGTRGRAELQPRFSFLAPSLEKRFRKGIRETERQKISGAHLLPVRKPILCHVNLGVRIEEFHGNNWEEESLKAKR